jgi:hypothetical protein
VENKMREQQCGFTEIGHLIFTVRQITEKGWDFEKHMFDVYLY